MTTIASARAAFLPFDEEEVARPRSRSRVRPGVAWALLPVLTLLVLAATGYISETAQGTALTYQVAQQQADQTELSNTDQVLSQELDQAQSAGAVIVAAAHLGLVPPSTWQVVASPPAGTADPLLPVLLALKGA